jgi:4-hydroxy-tetrahydrodipicolinate reductase
MHFAGEMARALGEDFDVEILELHHRMKKDAPSGTALKLASDVGGALGITEPPAVGSRNGERKSGQIGVAALRGGDVVGEHAVMFLGQGERIELWHRATRRELFAAGAMRAARWVVGQAPGLYGMAQVLGLAQRDPKGTG